MLQILANKTDNDFEDILTIFRSFLFVWILHLPVRTPLEIA